KGASSAKLGWFCSPHFTNCEAMSSATAARPSDEYSANSSSLLTVFMPQHHTGLGCALCFLVIALSEDYAVYIPIETNLFVVNEVSTRSKPRNIQVTR